MKKKMHKNKTNEAATDMTPMLDIVFIMLIFFIVTTTFSNDIGLNVLRPQQITNPEQTSKPLAFRIDTDGNIVMNNRQVDIRRIVANVQSFLAENNTYVAAVRAHPKAKHGIVVEVVNQIKSAGIDKISLLVDE